MSRLRWWVLLLCLLPQMGALTAETTLAVPTEVIYAPLEVQLGGTEQPLAVQPQALLPLTAGDSITTTVNGRALLTLADNAYLLLMPESRLFLQEIKETANGLYLDAALEGHLVLQTPPNFAWDHFTLRLAALDVLQPAEHFAVWAYPNAPVAVTVAAGTLNLVWQAQPATLEAGDGWFWDQRTAAPHQNAMMPPYHLANLHGQISPCQGTVLAEHFDSATVRAGADMSFTAISHIRNGTRVALLGQNADGTRLRVQDRTIYGWVERWTILDLDCPQVLPVYPTNFLEHNLESWLTRPIEVTLLTPFYGAKENNYYYRSFEVETP